MGGGYPKDLDPGSMSFGHIVRSHQDVYVDAVQCLESSMSVETGLLDDQSESAGGLGEVADRW